MDVSAKRRLVTGIMLVLITGCADGPAAPKASPSLAPFGPYVSASPSDTVTAASSATTGPTPTATPTIDRSSVEVDVDAAADALRALASLGPREATSGAYARAADFVEQKLEDLGYRLRRQEFGVPKGASWGVPVPAGTTVNIVAEPPDFDPGRRHLIIGAHLDTVPQSPGANDNASGVAAMLEVARLASAAPPRVPVVFIAFGAEEPRRPPGDSHFGSQAYVRSMQPGPRRALEGMLSVDAIGVSDVVGVCTGSRSSRSLRRRVLRTAERIDIPARQCQQRASDHWSFEQAGLPAVLVGGGAYPEYHTRRDLPKVISTIALSRTIRLVWAFIS